MNDITFIVSRLDYEEALVNMTTYTLVCTCSPFPLSLIEGVTPAACRESPAAAPSPIFRRNSTPRARFWNASTMSVCDGKTDAAESNSMIGGAASSSVSPLPESSLGWVSLSSPLSDPPASPVEVHG